MTFTRIPLRNRDGDVRAWVLVDDADAARANAHRWNLSGPGYAMGYISGSWVYLHRWLLGEPNGQVDHINRDKLDCRRTNLRDGLTDAENKQNVPARGGSSEHRGVFWSSQAQKWEARFGCPSKVRRQFPTETEAIDFITKWRAENLAYAEG